MSEDRYKQRLLIALFLISASIIAFQLALMQILSFVQWYHAAYLVISLAMLGFGAAGTFLAIFRKYLHRHFNLLISLLCLCCAVTMAFVPGWSQLPAIRFDSFLLFTERSQAGRMLITALVFFMPFFLGALAIGICFDKYVNQISKLYFSNLIGSGAGALLGLLSIKLFLPAQIPSILSLFPALGGLIVLFNSGYQRHPNQVHGYWARYSFFLKAAVALVAFTFLVWKIYDPPALHLSQFKDLSKTLLLPDAGIREERTSPYGLIQVVESPVLRYAPGLSLLARKTADVKAAVFVNGDWFGVVTGNEEGSHILDSSTLHLPFVISPAEKVLVLKAGTGMEVGHALASGASRVVAVEPNQEVVDLLKKDLANDQDSLYHHRDIYLKTEEPRTFLARDTSTFDRILLPVIGSFGGNPGLYALSEQYFLTVEAFSAMLAKLKPHGAIGVTAWMDYPPRNTLKILATMTEALSDQGVQNPVSHLAAIRSWNTISFIMKAEPLTENEISAIRDFCDSLQFDPALLPGLISNDHPGFHQLQDSSFFRFMEAIMGPDRDEFIAGYDFNIRPARDDKPYFSQFLRWGSLSRLSELFGNRALPFFEIGYLLVLVTLLQVTVISLALIILPLFRLGWRGKQRGRILAYFGAIGLGYIFIEIVLIQRFVLYFGSPVYAAALVISVLLIFSGAGSYYSGRIAGSDKNLSRVFGLIAGLLVFYSFILTPLLQASIHWTLMGRAFLTLFLIAPLGFMLGIPFPAGLQRVSLLAGEQVPWAWGINGCLSVVSAALAMIVSVEWGYSMVLGIAALAYFVPFMARLIKL